MIKAHIYLAVMVEWQQVKCSPIVNAIYSYFYPHGSVLGKLRDRPYITVSFVSYPSVSMAAITSLFMTPFHSLRICFPMLSTFMCRVPVGIKCCLLLDVLYIVVGWHLLHVGLFLYTYVQETGLFT